MPRNQKTEPATAKKNLILVAKNEDQKKAIKLIKEKEIIFLSGPAGTGKSFIALTFGLIELIAGRYKKIILTRPCIEAYGERLGFLPGDFKEKIEPYMIPLFDIALNFMDKKEIKSMLENNIILTLPLAFQRGLTFNDSIVIADEMQNSLPKQMRMVLTRLGFNSKIIVTGDPNQSDINETNGFSDATKRLKNISRIGIHHFSELSVMRNPIVKEIDECYNT